MKSQVEKNILDIENLSVNFRGFLAVDQVSLHVKEGELRVIIGPNGAGKTTLMDMITGRTMPTSGRILFDSKEIIGKSEPVIAEKFGIGRKFQSPTVFDKMSVFENVEVALKGYASIHKTLLYRRTKACKAKIQDILQQIHLEEEQHTLACYLSHGQRQWLEIGMLIAQDPKLLILDEPTAGMTADETYQTGELIRNMQGERTILVVEHDMDFVKQVAEQVTVLHMGKVFAEGTFDEVSNDERVIQIYLKDEEDA